MAKFLDKQGVWMAWDYGNGPEVVNFVSEDPIAVMVFIQNDGMGFPGFWPERMNIPEALAWWRENHINYVPRDRTKILEDSKDNWEAAVAAWTDGISSLKFHTSPEVDEKDGKNG